jgi:hypothetical protein
VEESLARIPTRNRFLQLFGILVRFSAMARDDITPKLTYPGIYVEEVPSGVRAIPVVSTSVTAFVGTIAGAALNQSIHLPCPRKILRSAGSKRRTFLGLGAILILAGTFFVGKLLTGGDLKDEQRARSVPSRPRRIARGVAIRGYHDADFHGLSSRNRNSPEPTASLYILSLRVRPFSLRLAKMPPAQLVTF